MESRSVPILPQQSGVRDGWVWFDLENTPHVLFLEPIVRFVRERGWRVRISAKPQAQTEELARARGLTCDLVGGGDFVGWAAKIGGGLARSASLARWVLAEGRPRLLVSSSRSASLAALALRVPALGLLDYEHAHHATLAWASRAVWLPDLLRGVAFGGRMGRVARYYAGLKENLYLDDWRIDRDSERKELAVGVDERVVVARPPATTAHYAGGPAFALWSAAVTALASQRCIVFVAARDDVQRREVRERLDAIAGVRVLERVRPGPGLVAAADLVVGGGGTMNREAAVLGVPVWSVFTGPTPHIDDRLAAEGRLRWIRSPEALALALSDPWPSRTAPRGPHPAGLRAVLDDVAAALS